PTTSANDPSLTAAVLLVQAQEESVMTFMEITGTPSSEEALKFLASKDYNLEAALSLFHEWKSSVQDVSLIFEQTGPPFYELLSVPLFELPGSRDRSGSLLLIVNLRFWRQGWTRGVGTGLLASSSAAEHEGDDPVDTLASVHWALSYMVERALEFPGVRQTGIVIISNVEGVPEHVSVASAHFVMTEFLLFMMPIKLKKLFVVNYSIWSFFSVIPLTEPLGVPVQRLKLEDLTIHFEPSSLPRELGGTLPYVHEYWFDDERRRYERYLADIRLAQEDEEARTRANITTFSEEAQTEEPTLSNLAGTDPKAELVLQSEGEGKWDGEHADDDLSIPTRRHSLVRRVGESFAFDLENVASTEVVRTNTLEKPPAVVYISSPASLPRNLQHDMENDSPTGTHFTPISLLDETSQPTNVDDISDLGVEPKPIGYQSYTARSSYKPEVQSPAILAREVPIVRKSEDTPPSTPPLRTLQQTASSSIVSGRNVVEKQDAEPKLKQNHSGWAPLQRKESGPLTPPSPNAHEEKNMKLDKMEALNMGAEHIRESDDVFNLPQKLQPTQQTEANLNVGPPSFDDRLDSHSKSMDDSHIITSFATSTVLSTDRTTIEKTTVSVTGRNAKEPSPAAKSSRPSSFTSPPLEQKRSSITSVNGNPFRSHEDVKADSVTANSEQSGQEQ
ncbi:hypothetical protein HK405_012004, partial [Cladochytrium tenue]